MILTSPEPVDVLCTLDICALLKNTQLDITPDPEMRSPVKVRIGINTSQLSKSDYLPLYTFINKYHYISFDFYDNSNFRDQNLIVVKNKAAILCSVDFSGKITLAVVITDPEKVKKYMKRPSQPVQNKPSAHNGHDGQGNDADRLQKQFLRLRRFSDVPCQGL